MRFCNRIVTGRFTKQFSKAHLQLEHDIFIAKYNVFCNTRKVKDVILNDLKSGNFIILNHARLRMKERGVSFSDIKECGATGNVKKQADGKFKVKGLDVDAEELTVICAYEDRTLIVTLY